MIINPTGSGTDPAHLAARYLLDVQVDAGLDAEIRDLLCRCFTAPEHARFRTQRYYHTPYSHRWVLRAEAGSLVAHAGIHERELQSGTRRFSCGALSDVCVHPEYRCRGLLKQLLGEVHRWLCQRGCAFAVLFGEARIYRSSGYRAVELFLETPPAGMKQPLPALARCLGKTDWPAEPPTMDGGLV